MQHGMESIVYAVEWNQLKENVLGGAAWLAAGGGAEVIEQLRKPTALVCSARGAHKNPLSQGRKQRDDLLKSHIRATIAKGGTVLIPSDSSAKVLELAYVLERMWQTENSDPSNDNPFKGAKLYFASRTAGATMRYVRSMLEWMDDKMVREFEAAATNANLQQNKRGGGKSNDAAVNGVANGPFDFRYLRLLERNTQVDKMLSRSGPRVIVASDSSLQWGFSKEILGRIAGESRNLVILTREYQGSGDMAMLWKWYQDREDGIATETKPDGQILEQVYSGGRSLTVHDIQAVPLEGEELLLYQQYLVTRRQADQGPDGLGLESSADVVDEASSTSSSSSEDSNPERQGKALNASATVAHLNRNKVAADNEVLGVNALLRQPGVYDYDVRGKKGREQVFPYLNKRRRGDEYGELIRPEDYLRAEERDEAAGHGMEAFHPTSSTELGQKRKWTDSRSENIFHREVNAKRHKASTLIDEGVHGANGSAELRINGDEEDDEEVGIEGTAVEWDIITSPSKLEMKDKSIDVSLRLGFVDFSSLHDQRSLSMLLPLIQPQKLLLTCGSVSDTDWLADDYLRKLQLTSEDTRQRVFAPCNGELSNASIDTSAWTVKLSRLLTKQLQWQNVRGRGVATLTGHLMAANRDHHASADIQDRKRQKLLHSSPEPKADLLSEEHATTAPNAALPPILDLLPVNVAAASRSMGQTIHVGDLRLADLRKFLQSEEHSADFRGEGTLIIDDLVAVRKTSTGKIEVEGGGMSLPPPYRRTRTMEGSFHAVKRRIYEGLAVIAAG